MKQYVKPKKSAEIQTESIKEITASYEQEIEKLEHNISLMQSEYDRALKDATKLNYICRDLTTQKNKLNEELQELTLKSDKNNREMKDFAYREQRLKQELEEIRKMRDQVKNKLTEVEAQANEYQFTAGQLKGEVSDKNKMINSIRDDVKDLAVAKIRLTKKTETQEIIIKKLQDQIKQMIENAKKAGATDVFRDI